VALKLARSRGVSGDHIFEELVSRQVIVGPVGHEMASLRDGQVAEGSAVSVVASSTVSTSLLIPHIVDLPGLLPEASSHVQFPYPGVLCCGTILGVKFTGVDQDRRSTGEELVKVARVVDHAVTLESLTYFTVAHLENGNFRARFNMDGGIQSSRVRVRYAEIS